MIYFALAAYNEEANITDVLKGAHAMAESFNLEVQVVVVNDGSTDGTSKAVHAFQEGCPLQVHLIEQENAGFTKALECAVKRVVDFGEDGDICVTMDADNSHPTSLVPEMVTQMEGGKDIVIASRFKAGGRMIGVPWHRHVLSWGARIFMRKAAPIPHVEDYSTAFRAYRVKLLKKAFKAYPEDLFGGSGFSGIAGSLLRMSYLTDAIGEIPLELRYDLKKGPSHLNIFTTLKGYLDLARSYSRGDFKPK